MDILPTEEAQKRFQELMKTIVQEREQIKITSEEGNVVMMSEGSYNDLLITLEFLSTPGLMDILNMHKAEQIEFEFEDENKEVQAWQ